MKRSEQLAHLTRKIAAMRIPVYAGNASFFLVLSLFPMVTLLLGVLPVTPLGVEDLVGFLANFMPPELLPLLEGMIRTLYAIRPGAVIPVSVLAALWSASSGTLGILYGLNAVLGVQETRSYLRRRLVCSLYTLGVMLAVVLTLLLNVWGKELLAVLHMGAPRSVQTPPGLLRQLHLYSAALLTLLFTGMYLALPNVRQRLLHVVPGAAAAACAWVAFSTLFSFYVNQFAHSSALYGSLTVIVLTLLWLFVCMMILFYGALLNRLLFRKDTDV